MKKRQRREKKKESLDRTNRVVFKLGAVEDHGILFAGLYPPAKSSISKQHENITSLFIKRAMGDSNFDWIDIFPFSPMRNSDLDQRELKKYLTGDDGKCDRADWLKRLQKRVRLLHTKNVRHPVIYLCGDTINSVVEKMSGEFNAVECLSQALDIWTYEIGGIECIVLLNHPHPSAHLMARGETQARHRFHKSMRVVSAVRKCVIEKD